MVTGMQAGEQSTVTQDSMGATRPGVTWGVRRSFVGYIRALGDGGGAVGQGATETPDGAFHFPLTAEFGVEGEAERWIRSRGVVRFQGHGGMLTVPLAGLSIRVVPTAATLFCEQPDGSVYPLADIQLGEPAVDEHSLIWPDAPVVLTAEGARYFGGQYPAGTPMDPIRIQLPLR